MMKNEELSGIGDRRWIALFRCVADIYFFPSISALMITDD